MEVAERKVVYDREDQLRQIQSGLMPGEVLYAVYDGKGAGTRFLAVTDKRVIIQDKSYIGKKIAMISMPFNRIADVGVLSNQSVFGNYFSTSEILIRTLGGDRHEIEFRGTDKARYIHDLILHYITQDARQAT
jgi:hypothetical protein